MCAIYLSFTCTVGEPIMDASGELVCTKPFPSMPSHFWNNLDGAKYKKAYFSKYPGMFVAFVFCKFQKTFIKFYIKGRKLVLMVQINYKLQYNDY